MMGMIVARVLLCVEGSSLAPSISRSGLRLRFLAIISPRTSLVHSSRMDVFFFHTCFVFPVPVVLEGTIIVYRYLGTFATSELRVTREIFPLVGSLVAKGLFSGKLTRTFMARLACTGSFPDSVLTRFYFTSELLGC